MIFKLYYASDFKCHGTIVFDSLEEIKNFSLKQGHAVVLNFVTMEIWVYDDYLE